jgi:hypothetical protein
MVSIAVEKRARSLTPAITTIPEDASNPFHLSRREAVSFANLQALVPDLPLDRDLFL